MTDFQTADIDELMNTSVDVVEEKEDINKVLLRYDRSLMDFSTNVGRRQNWPEPIRKRVCIK